MAKKKTIFMCNECGHEEPKWLGRCPECGSWNSFREIQAVGDTSGKTGGAGGAGPRRGGAGTAAGNRGKDFRPLQALPIENVELAENVRIDSGIEELNRVLGGGIMLGASVLIGGDPGIGKSTLMLQLAAQVEAGGKVLYVSGEESAPQIRMRAERLGIIAGSQSTQDTQGGHGSSAAQGSQGSKSAKSTQGTQGGHGSSSAQDVKGEKGAKGVKAAKDIKGVRGNGQLHLACESDLDRIMAVLRELKPRVVVIDSIQTLLSQEAGSIPGTVNQLKYGCYELIDWAREQGAAIFLVAHVTKEGAIAGPKVIEHMVDTVLYFEQAGAGLRIVRAAKNRHGSVDEIGLFTMEETGLEQVVNPASFFLQQRKGALPPGITAAPVYEGSRVLMVEIQALVVPAKSGFSRIYSDKIDSNRVSRVAAVLEKHLSVRFSDQDMYVNVAGGIRLNEVGIELPLAMALYSARTGIPVPRGTAMAGEVSLAGEIRPTAHMLRRVRTAVEMGFERFFGPRDVTRKDEQENIPGGKIGLTVVNTIGEGVTLVFGKGKPG